MRFGWLPLSMVLIALLHAPHTACAGLAPTKGSQLVTAFTVGACPIQGHTGQNSLLVTQMVNADGSTVPFAIPPKHIFVITDVMTATGSEPGGDIMLVDIAIGSAATGNLVAGRFDTVAANGSVTSTFQFPTGVAVKSGTAICVEMLNLSHPGFTGFSAFVHGYVAPDK